MTTPGPHKVAMVTSETLTILESQLGNPGIPDMHRQRFLVQVAGRGLYLAAWRRAAPVGNVLLRFSPPPNHACAEHHAECAYVEALDVRPEARRQGVALALMREAQSQASARGAGRIGLSVGLENAPARALYRKLGYQPTELAPYFVSWTYLDPQTGEPKEEGEMCSFWLKSLGG